jgi:hypothetical protein
MKKAGLIALPLILLATGSLLAQSMYGGIEGTVTSTENERLPGVAVSVSSEAMQGTRSTVTQTNGTFRFSLLPPGIYTLDLSLSGYQPIRQEKVRVPIEGMVTLSVTMTATATGEISVTAEPPLIDYSSPAIGSNFDRQVIDAVPVGRDFTSVVFLATGAVDGGGISNEDLAGNPSIMGASVLENRYIVDQLDTTDVVYGYSGTGIPADFIDEVQIKTGGYEAEFGGALGGVVNMITRSGGNELHGDVFTYFSNDSLWADPEIPRTRGETRGMDQEYDVGLTLGGKIIEDRLWFFFGYNPSILQQEIINDIYQGDAIYQRNQIARDTERDYYTGKLTWQVSDNSSLVANVIGDPTSVDNDFATSNYIDSPLVAETNQLYSRELGGINFGLSWSSILRDNLFFEARVGSHRSQDELIPHLYATSYQDGTADAIWSDGVSGNVWFGGPNLQRPLDDRSRDQARMSLNWYTGKHAIKLGAGYNRVAYDIDWRAVGATGPQCVPSSIPGGGLFFMPFAEDPFVPYNCSLSGNGELDGVMVPARTGNQFHLGDGIYYNLVLDNRSAGRTNEYSIYLQDDWKVTDTLSLQIGIRAESSESKGDLTRRYSAGTLDFGFGDMIAPRVGFTWDFLGNGRSKISGHYGKFYQSIPLDINVRMFGNEIIDFILYFYPDDGSLPSATNPGPLYYFYRISTATTRVDPNIDPQYLEELVFGVEQEVRPNLVVGAKYIRRELGKVIEDISVDGGFTFFVTNPGGVFTENPATGEPLDEPVDFPTAERTFDGLELSLHKRLSNNWQLYASALWSQLEGNYEGLYSRHNGQLDPNITAMFDLPELLENAWGYLDNDREWQIKAFGSYHFDFGLVTGFNFFFLTGTPISKKGSHALYGFDNRFVTPRGSEGRTDSWWNLDLHLSYPFDLGSTRLEVMLDAFNLLDQQPAIEVDQRWTVSSEGSDQTNPNWGDPLLYPDPRNLRLGLRLSW